MSPFKWRICMCWRTTRWSCIFIFQGGNFCSSHWRPQHMVGKPGGNPCRPLCFFEVALQAAATGGAKYGTVASSEQKTLTPKSKHSRCRLEAKLLRRLSPNVNTRAAKQHSRCAIRFSRNVERNHTHTQACIPLCISDVGRYLQCQFVWQLLQGK